MNQDSTGAAPPQAGLAILVTWVAGFVDAVGFLSLYRLYTANMSGNSVSVGIQIASGGWAQVFRNGWPVAVFTAGLFIGAMVLEWGDRTHVRRIVAVALALEAVLLVGFLAAGGSMLQHGEVHAPNFWTFYGTVALPALAMGIQDATITRIGGLSVRTTHVTGSIVHFAAAGSEYLFWLHDRTAGRIRRRFGKALRVSARQACFREALMMSGLWISYVVGAACGAGLKTVWELNALAIPLAALALLLIVDLFRPTAISQVERSKPK